MRRRLLTASLVLVAVGSAGCGPVDSPGNDAAALASRGRASLLSTFADTPFRLKAPRNTHCTSNPVGDPEADDRAGIACALTSNVMARLEQALDKGLGSGVTASQKSCINRRLTRDQVAALLSGELGVGRAHAAATAADFDRQLASIIAFCIAR